MDKSYFYRPKMSKLLRKAVAEQLRRDSFKFESEDFRASVIDHYERSVKKAA